MAFEEFRVQLTMLLDAISNQPEDMHELQESLREKLAEMEALGLPLPEDLVGLEAYLEEGFGKTADLREVEGKAPPGDG